MGDIRIYSFAILTNLCNEQFCEADAAQDLYNKTCLGASTTDQKRGFIWASRVSAVLSFGGASFIFYDVLSDPKFREDVYYRLLLAMAVFDLATAIAWVFAKAPIDPKDKPHVEGAIGTVATCRTQAFFVQLGFTSCFYNVSMALYYVLLVGESSS